MITKRILFLLLVCAAAFFAANQVRAQSEPEPADNFQLQSFLTEEQALAVVFPDCDEIVADNFVMAPEEKSRLETVLSRRLCEDGFVVYLGKKGGVLQGYAIITEEIGKFHPFTFIVRVQPDGKINNLAILVYRESRGGEIAKKRFLYQFVGKSFKNPIRINKDIINITGVTMSVQWMCAGVRKALAVISEYYLSGKRVVADAKATNVSTALLEKKKSGEGAGDLKNVEDSEKPLNNKEGVGVVSEVKLVKQTRMIMGTFAEVSVYSDDEKIAGKAIEASLDEMERMDRIMSNYKDDSELSQVNKNAAKSPVPCGRELLEVLEHSLHYSELSDGAFDVTVSPVIAAWGFFTGKGRIPSDKELAKLLPVVSYRNIVINKGSNPEKPGAILFKHPQTKIDLGAIGKGYAVDKALEIVSKYAVNNACINLGGNIYVRSAPAGKNAWKVGVQHPRNKAEILGYLELKDESTATSGDYERFIEIKGKRYSHIVDPRTGMPVKDVVAVTIVAPTGTAVDALSTSVFVLGLEKGMNLVKSIPGVDAMIACQEKDGVIGITMTDGFRKKFKITNAEGDGNVRWHVVASGKQ
jgi:thiamine biosynthesis lipoprotein ApbE